MAFRDFGFPDVATRLGLHLRDGVLFPHPHSVDVRPEFAAFVKDGAELAAMTSTEKGRSEFVIGPVLLELRRTGGRKFNLFSGADWDVDRDRGLNGVCDFLITHGPSQFFISYPVTVVVEAKNYEFHSGFGQCISGMFAATVANAKAGIPEAPVHGAVTYGRDWKFLRLQDGTVTIDTDVYDILDMPRLMGVLDEITRRPANLPAA